MTFAIAAVAGCGSASPGDLFGATGGRGEGTGGSAPTGGATTGGGSSTGGSSAGGTTGGSSPTSMGGSITGGANAGEAGQGAEGGDAAAGASGALGTGGDAGAGGATTGGADNTSGGASTGGATTGGASTGGASTGGATTGGADSTSGGSTDAGEGGVGASGGEGGGGNSCTSEGEELCDGVDNDCDTLVDEDACGGKCRGFVLAERRYMVCNTETAFNAAPALCEAENMRMAWLETQSEDQAVFQQLKTVNPTTGPIKEVYFGAADEKEGQWRWLAGAEFWAGNQNGNPVANAYTHWGSGQPNNGEGGQDCIVLVVDEPTDGDPSTWNDVPCNEKHAFLCERP